MSKDITAKSTIHMIYECYGNGDYHSFDKAVTQLADLLDRDKDRLVFELLCILNEENKKLIASINTDDQQDTHEIKCLINK